MLLTLKRYLGALKHGLLRIIQVLSEICVQRSILGRTLFSTAKPLIIFLLTHLVSVAIIKDSKTGQIANKVTLEDNSFYEDYHEI